jgi:fibronectin type 3 domain-containing protein
VTAGGSSTLTVNAGTAAPGTYSLTVTGTGPSATHSTTVSLTVSGKPGAPTLTAARGRLPGVQLSWTVPASNGSPISAYRIYRSTTSGAEAFLTSVGTGVTSYRDTATVSNRTYFYKVSAVNGNGEGPFSNEASSKAR